MHVPAKPAPAEAVRVSHKRLSPRKRGQAQTQISRANSDRLDRSSLQTLGPVPKHRNYRWTESTCIETNSTSAIGRESYSMNADGILMPVRTRRICGISRTRRGEG